LLALDHGLFVLAIERGFGTEEKAHGHNTSDRDYPLEELKKSLLHQALTGALQGQFANHPHDMDGGAGAWHVFSHGVAPSFSPRRASRGNMCRADNILSLVGAMSACPDSAPTGLDEHGAGAFTHG